MPYEGKTANNYAIEDTSLDKGQQVNYLHIHYPKYDMQQRLLSAAAVFSRQPYTGYNYPATLNGGPAPDYGKDCRTDM